MNGALNVIIASVTFYLFKLSFYSRCSWSRNIWEYLPVRC